MIILIVCHVTHVSVAVVCSRLLSTLLSRIQLGFIMSGGSLHLGEK